MSDNKGIVWKWAVLVLAVCNIALMATIWLRPAQGGGQRPEMPREFLIRNVKLTQDQVKQYDVLITAHHSAMDSLRQEAMRRRQQLFSSLKDPTGAANADVITNEIAALQKTIELVTYRHFEQVRALCTDAQKPDFDRVIGDVIRKMNGRHPGGPPPPGMRGDGQHDGPPPPDGHGPPEGEGPPPGGPER